MATARPSPSRRLPRGRSALDAEEIAGHHRRRLYEATIALLGEQGYGATTVQELASQAGVSTKDFYDLFAGKQQLVLAACDAVIQDACAPLRARPVAEGDLRAALAAVLSAVVDVVVAEPAAARLAVVDIVAVGPQGIARRRSLSTGLHDLLRRAATVEGVPVLSEAALTVLAGGTLHVLDGHLRAGKLRPLRSAAQELAAWGALYETEQAAGAAGPRPVVGGDRRHPSSARCPAGATACRRDSCAATSARGSSKPSCRSRPNSGFEATSVKDLIAAAGLSPQAFYDNFASKEEAWAAAFEESFSQLYLAAWRAASPQDDRATQVGATVAACLHYLASEPGAGAAAARRRAVGGPAGAPAIDEALRGFEHLIAPALTGPGLPKLLPTAMIGGLRRAGRRLGARGPRRPAAGPDRGGDRGHPDADARAGRRRARGQRRRYGGAPRPPPSTTTAIALSTAFAEAVARDGLRATRLADVAQEAGIELDVANALFDDELDCATKALDAWAGQLVIIAAGAFLSAAGDPPLAAHRALEAALWHIARTPAVRGAGGLRRSGALAGGLGVAGALHRPVLPAHRRPGPGRRAARPAAAGGAGAGVRRDPRRRCAASPRSIMSPSCRGSYRR